MKLVLLTVQWVCEFCGHKEIVQTANENQRPPGWGFKTVSGFGLTGYTKDMDCCPECNKKTLKNDGERFFLE